MLRQNFFGGKRSNKENAGYLHKVLLTLSPPERYVTQLPKTFLLNWISRSLSQRPDWSAPFWSVMRPSGGFSVTSSSQPGLIGSGHMGAGDTYDLPVAVAWYRRRLTESSSSRATKNSSSRSRRNWGFTRNWPTTPNKRTKPRGVHTEKDKEMIIRFNL